jgi:hypothetical protein
LAKSAPEGATDMSEKTPLRWAGAQMKNGTTIR